MVRSKFFLRTVLLFSLLITSFVLTHAQANRTWVSGVGDDANPCSRTAPCKTFAGGVLKTAAGGELNCLDPGAFGAVTITKSITIDCSATFGGILAPTGNGITINVAGTGVVKLRGVSINGFGTGGQGIDVIDAAKVYVENSVIDGFANNGIRVENVHENLQIWVDNTTIRNIGGPGINIEPNGAYTAALTATNSRISATINAIQIAKSDSSVTNCILNGNITALNAAGFGILRISGNTISGNINAFIIQVHGAIISYGNNAISGNIGGETPTQTFPLK